MGSPILKQKWFMVKRDNAENMHYIYRAETYAEVVKSFGEIAKGQEILQLTWRQLSELTGCLIPCQCKPKDYAVGKLMFIRKGNFITFM